MTGKLDTPFSRLRMRQLQLLSALDEHKSLHRAAGVMSMTQSAASKALAEVESMFGETLFERSKRGLTPNLYGQSAVRYARAAIADLCDDFVHIRSGSRGQVSVGAIMGAIPEVLGPAISDMHARHPSLSLEIVEDTSARMLGLLADGKLDLVIGRSSVADQPSRFLYQSLGDEPLCVVVGHRHPPLRRKSLSLDALAGHGWISYPEGTPMRLLLEREIDLAGLPAPVAFIATASTHVTVTLLSQNVSLASILPKSVAAMFVRERLIRVLPIVLRSPSPTFGIVTRRDVPLSGAAREFIGILQAHGQRKSEASTSSGATSGPAWSTPP